MSHCVSRCKHTDLEPQPGFHSDLHIMGVEVHRAGGMAWEGAHISPTCAPNHLRNDRRSDVKTRGRDHTGECHLPLSPWKHQEKRDFPTLHPDPRPTAGKEKQGRGFLFPLPTPTLQNIVVTLGLFTQVRNHVLGPGKVFSPALSLPSALQVGGLSRGCP